MNALLGVIFHFIGGFASGSFYIPYKKVFRYRGYIDFCAIGRLGQFFKIKYIKQ